VRYFIEDVPSSIAFLIGIYDVVSNLGLQASEGAPALLSCVDNACTVWGDRYLKHPSWGVAFYDRSNGPEFHTNLLRLHIFFNSVTFLLLHYQLWRPGTGSNRDKHRRIGRVSFASLTAGTFCAVWLASEHGSISEYGGNLARNGFYSMSAFVYGTAIMGVYTIRQGDAASHQIWMIRLAGSMWGAFWLFRVMLLVTGPLLRNYEAASFVISTWGSAPLGILIAEVYRRRSIRLDKRL
jgi:hypothetical protein